MNKNTNRLLLQIVVCSAFFLGLLACTNNQVENTRKMEEETSNLHDEIMPITFKIRALKDSLTKMEKSFEPQKKEKAVLICKEIQDADNAMDGFMNQLGEAINMENTDPKKLKLLETLKVEGATIKKQTIDVKQKAESFLKN